MAERQGFEPWIPCGIHAFQACAFSHSAISPRSSHLLESNTTECVVGMRRKLVYLRRLGLYSLFEPRRRSEIYWNTMHHVATEGRGIFPIDLPAVVDCEEDIFSRQHIVQFKAPISIGLVATNNIEVIRLAKR